MRSKKLVNVFHRQFFSPLGITYLFLQLFSINYTCIFFSSPFFSLSLSLVYRYCSCCDYSDLSNSIKQKRQDKARRQKETRDNSLIEKTMTIPFVENKIDLLFVFYTVCFFFLLYWTLLVFFFFLFFSQLSFSFSITSLDESLTTLFTICHLRFFEEKSFLQFIPSRLN